MNYSTTGLEVTPLQEGCVFDVGSLYAHFQQLRDKRKARGKRYPLEVVLVLVILAKLSGEDRPSGIADWAQRRCEVLRQALGVSRGRLPCHNTYRRVLREAVDVGELQASVGRFLTQKPGTGHSVLIAMDGKTLRGAIPSGHTHGIHLLAAYLPGEGITLMPAAVDRRENEICAAPSVLGALDLSGKVVVADAMHTQRELSAQIVQAGGDYVWLAKDHQRQLHRDIAEVFEPEVRTPGFSSPPDDFETAQTVNKGHGRLEKRILTTSRMLCGYTDWPDLQQVFQLTRHISYLKRGTHRQEVVYGLTSLAQPEAGPARLLGLVRNYWGIENGLHYRRDKTLQEDATRMTSLTLAQAMAILNNLVIGLVAQAGWHYLPQARRYYNACLPAALRLVLRPPG